MSEPGSGNPIRNLLLVIALAGGAWFFFNRFEIDGLDEVAIRARNAKVTTAAAGRAAAAGNAATDAPPHAGPAALGLLPTLPVGFESERAVVAEEVPPAVPGEVVAARRVRVGSWALAGFGRDKASKPHVMDLLSRLVRSFDVIALQQLAVSDRDLLPRMVEHINRAGRHYDFLLAAPATPYASGGEQLAFLFDTERIVTDRSQLYTVTDPQDVLTHDPVVGWFRVVGPSPQAAWTFSLVNVRIELARARQEVAVLPGVLSAVRSDGRGEDDILMAGLFQADDAYLVPTVGSSLVTAAIRATPTDIFGIHQTQNLLLPTAATTEYLGTGGPVGFLRLYNLTLAEAEELTPHLPVYGEFAPVEGL